MMRNSTLFTPLAREISFKLDKEKGCWVDTRPEEDIDDVELKRCRNTLPLRNILDAIVKGDQEQLDKYIAKCQAVKIKNPKP